MITVLSLPYFENAFREIAMTDTSRSDAGLKVECVLSDGSKQLHWIFLYTCVKFAQRLILLCIPVLYCITSTDKRKPWIRMNCR